MKNRWEVKYFTANQIDEGIKAKKFVIPAYQRGIIWKDTKKEKFVDTLIRGLPFGTILLYFDEENNQYQIIDGLQRCTTINSFINNPQRYFNEDLIDENLPIELAKITGVSNYTAIVNEVKEHFIDWVRTSCKTMEQVKNLQYGKYCFEFPKKYVSAKDQGERILDIITPTLDKYKESCTYLCDVQIPAIVIHGDDDVLPEVFQRINSQGSQLTKYEVYAAAFSRKTYTSETEMFQQLLQYNRDRYEHIGGEGIGIESFDPAKFMSQKTLNLFEISYGLGKLLGKKFPHLFKIDSKMTAVDSVGFSLITACVGLRNEDSNKLPYVFDTVVTDIALFLERIIECTNKADKLIRAFNTFKLNSKEKAMVGPLHAELQIISLVANIFIARYATYDKNDNDQTVNFNLCLEKSNDDWSLFEKELKSNAWKRYCLDIFSKAWKSSGDKVLNGVIFEKSYYTQLISWTDFENSIRQWYVNGKLNNKEYKKIDSPHEAEKLFLAIVYLKEFSAEDQADGSKYDVEHLATKGLMKKKLKRFADNGNELKVPISSVGNLCLLPQSENRGKKEKTIYEDNTFLQKSNFTLSELEKKFTFTAKEDLEWLNNDPIGREEFEQQYIEYIDKRFNRMLDKIKEERFQSQEK